MEVENETFNQDDTDLEENLNQTAFLLQRIRELQTWQQEQERQLLREQELQIGRLVDANSRVIHFTTTTENIGNFGSTQPFPVGFELLYSITLIFD